MQVMASNYGSYMDQRGCWHVAGGLTAQQVRRLFDAAAKDRVGRARGGGWVVDEDIADMQTDSWRKQLKRYRPYWERMLPPPEVPQAHKPGLPKENFRENFRGGGLKSG